MFVVLLAASTVDTSRGLSRSVPSQLRASHCALCICTACR